MPYILKQALFQYELTVLRECACIGVSRIHDNRNGFRHVQGATEAFILRVEFHETMKSLGLVDCAQLRQSILIETAEIRYVSPSPA